MILRIAIILLIAAVTVGNCQEMKVADTAAKGVDTMAFTLTSSAFKEGEMIPKQFTCDGADMSPELSWMGAPEKTKSFALITDDPDAPRGTWVHWVMYNIPPDTHKLAQGISGGEKLDDGSRHGVSDFKKFGYGGPCPPSGTHRYFFKLYALDKMLDLKGKVTKQDLLKAMEGHVLAEAQLMGKYSRGK